MSVAPTDGKTLIGIQKTSLVDYPGLVAATLFFTGCNLRCPFCHNPDLSRGVTSEGFVEIDEAMAFLARRSRVLGGVCLSGGEPTLSSCLPGLVDMVHELGLKVKVDTNGLLPDRLFASRPDYIALDLKTSPRRYPELYGHRSESAARGANKSAPVVAEGVGAASKSAVEPFTAVGRTIDLLRSMDVQYEFRTTVVPGLVEQSDAQAIMEEILAGESWFLQTFRPGRVLDPIYFATVEEKKREFLVSIRDRALAKGIKCSIRGDT